jgi:hypothetical protein
MPRLLESGGTDGRDSAGSERTTRTLRRRCHTCYHRPRVRGVSPFLLADNPFPGSPPRYIRAQFYRDQFAPPANPEGVWWTRTLLGTWLPPLSIDDPRLQRFLAAHGWLEDPDARSESEGAGL